MSAQVTGPFTKAGKPGELCVGVMHCVTAACSADLEPMSWVLSVVFTGECLPGRGGGERHAGGRHNVRAEGGTRQLRDQM